MAHRAAAPFQRPRALLVPHPAAPVGPGPQVLRRGFPLRPAFIGSLSDERLDPEPLVRGDHTRAAHDDPALLITQRLAIPFPTVQEVAVLVRPAPPDRDHASEERGLSELAHRRGRPCGPAPGSTSFLVEPVGRILRRLRVEQQVREPACRGVLLGLELDLATSRLTAKAEGWPAGSTPPLRLVRVMAALDPPRDVLRFLPGALAQDGEDDTSASRRVQPFGNTHEPCLPTVELVEHAAHRPHATSVEPVGLPHAERLGFAFHHRLRGPLELPPTHIGLGRRELFEPDVPDVEPARLRSAHDITQMASERSQILRPVTASQVNLHKSGRFSRRRPVQSQNCQFPLAEPQPDQCRVILAHRNPFRFLRRCYEIDGP